MGDQATFFGPAVTDWTRPIGKGMGRPWDETCPWPKVSRLGPTSEGLLAPSS